MKKLALTLPKTKLQPPPKKSEVIDALAKLEVEKRNTKLRADVEKRKSLEKECADELTALVLRDPLFYSANVNFGRDWGGGDGKIEGVEVQLSVQDKQFPADLKKKFKEMRALPSRYCDARFHIVRKEITQAVNQIAPHDERVASMLADESTKASLEKMLEVISK